MMPAPLAKVEPAPIYPMRVIISIMKMSFYAKDTSKRLGTEFRCHSAADCTKIPLPAGWPNRIQVIDIQRIFDVERTLLGVKRCVFPAVRERLSAAARGVGPKTGGSRRVHRPPPRDRGRYSGRRRRAASPARQTSAGRRD